MRVGVVGVGMVGEVVKYGMERLGHDVVCHDVKWAADSRIERVLETDLTFVCVPTPSRSDGSCNTEIVEDVVLSLDSLKYSGLTVVKSTVTPGTTDTLSRKIYGRIAFCPEFLKERSRFVDFVEDHDVCITGAHNEEDHDLIRESHGHFPKRFERLTPTEAELAKYFSNTFNALRIVFACQFYDVCQAAGADYSAIKRAIVSRRSIGDHYLECNKNFREFGGHCLPKDTRAFSHFASSVGAGSALWEDIIRLNEGSKL